MKNIDHCEFQGKKVLIRVDFNVPLNEDLSVKDNTRIKAALPTINKVLDEGGAVIIMSHLGRPKSGPEARFSLQNIVSEVSGLLGRPVRFASDCVGPQAESAASELNSGEVLLLENLRFHKHETAGTESFAEGLARLGDFYINDAFGTAHRAHASTAIIAQYFPDAKCFGYLMANEISSIEKVLKSGHKPVTAILGGAKVSSKISIIENLMEKVDHLIIGGGMVYSFVKAMGGKVGSSLVEDDKLDLARTILEKAEQLNVTLHLPTDTYVADAFSNDANQQLVKVDEIPDGWMGLDIGPESSEQFRSVLSDSKTILWNGPMGVFEMSNFEKGTKEIANAVADATASGAFSLIGGGDSVAAINQFGMAGEVSYVSTGGGALLEYLEGITLPGIAAMN